MQVVAYQCPVTGRLFKTERWQKRCTKAALKRESWNRRSEQCEATIKAEIREFAQQCSSVEELVKWVLLNSATLDRLYRAKRYSYSNSADKSFEVREMNVLGRLTKGTVKVHTSDHRTLEYKTLEIPCVSLAVEFVMRWESYHYNGCPLRALRWHASFYGTGDYSGTKPCRSSLHFTQEDWPVMWHAYEQDTIEAILKGEIAA